MKTLIIALAALTTASIASADGFVCVSTAQDLKVHVFNHVTPQAGTRNGAVMVLSNPKVSLGRKTIAKFDSEGLLSNEASRYTADVDLRFTDSSRKGELIAGTKLGYIDSMVLDVDFTYAAPVISGTVIDGVLTIAKRNGESTLVNMECERYLKN